MDDKVILFSEVFGDTENVAKSLFSCRGVITLTEYIEGRLAAMASLIRINGKNSKGFYVYGVCVAKDFRGRGYFRKIMDAVESYANTEGADFLCLIPANDALQYTYHRMGYVEKIKPFEYSTMGNLFITSEDFKMFATPDTPSPSNNGLSGLAKIIKNDFKFESEPIFADFMGDI